jgi:hypothetical protein
MYKYTFNNLLKELKNKHIHMLIGNGSKNQFKNKTELKQIIKSILKNLPENSVFLYFGDPSNDKKPDVGYAFELISLFRPDIGIYMIQISEAESWGVPSFVTGVYWHNDYTKKCKWGGLNTNNQPCSNTKKWVNINKAIGIRKVFILGGGEITLQEYYLIKQHDIDYFYIPLERKFKGDGVTKIKSTDTQKTKIGITYKKIKN